MPTPFVSSQYDDEHEPQPVEEPLTGKPVMHLPWHTWVLAISISALVWIVGFVAISHARTRQGPAPTHHVGAAPAAARARAECPDTATPAQCRRALIKAYSSLTWQRRARWLASATTSKDVVRDAIHWASSLTGVPAWQLANIANCESHLFFLAHNGQFLGVWQLGAMHRSDPIFRVVPWMDPYAQAIHVARFIKNHGESQWQCSSTGGLRW